MPGEKLDVFISSDIKEFEVERKRLEQAICKIPFCSCVPLEKRGADTTDVVASSLKATRDCDVYVGIFGRNYSDPTNKEYNEAVKHHKACLTYVKKVKRRDFRLTEFVRNDLANRFKYHEFKRRKDLYRQVETDLRKLIFDTLKDGLKFRESEKERAIHLIASGMELPQVVASPTEEMSEAERAYTEGKYLESIVLASIALERFLRDRLKVTDGRSRAMYLGLGQLIRLATEKGIVRKNMTGALLETSYIRNTVMHGMRTPDRRAALMVMKTVNAVLASFEK